MAGFHDDIAFDKNIYGGNESRAIHLQTLISHFEHKKTWIQNFFTTFCNGSKNFVNPLINFKPIFHFYTPSKRRKLIVSS